MTNVWFTFPLNLWIWFVLAVVLYSIQPWLFDRIAKWRLKKLRSEGK